MQLHIKIIITVKLSHKDMVNIESTLFVFVILALAETVIFLIFRNFHFPGLTLAFCII